MSVNSAVVEAAIRARLVEICDELGEDARTLDADEILPASGLIDSAGLLALITWYEAHFGITIQPEEFTIDHLGSIALMTKFVMQRQGGGSAGQIG